IFLRRDAVEVRHGIEKVVENEPETSGVAGEQQWKDHRKRHPKRELLVDVHAGEGIEQKEPGHSDAYRGGIVDVHRADEITLLALELQAAVSASGMHAKHLGVQRADAAARAFKAQAVPQHSNTSRHFRPGPFAASDRAAKTRASRRLGNGAGTARYESAGRL